ncbi:MAG TPA: FtsX-like permease family protein [Thermoleophilaceae bacterium]
MLTITLRDLQWRARRFALGVAATSLVFSMTLILTGLVAGFGDEIDRTVSTFHGDRWVVPAGASGPFTSTSPVTESARARVLQAPGVRGAEPVVIFRHTARDGGDEHQLNVIAAQPGGLVRPKLAEGRAIAHDGEAIVDEMTGIALGRSITVGDTRLKVVGRTDGLTYFAGQPVLVMSLRDGRHLAYDDAPLASAIVTRGVPEGALPGLKAMDSAAVKKDLRKPVSGATTTIAILAVILALIAAGIIGLMTYLSGLDRLVDFAVFKAIGVRTGKLLAGLVLQVLLLALVSAGLASVLAVAIAPAIPIGVSLSATSFAALLGLAVAVGLAVSIVNVRQATSVDPALAFGRG